ncbi:uncharacterized protein LOC135336864 [Halichondria panicea]|uniref:uncharacterized protein LOC135336864 n=1 Tax=Halichondria panicea TaxID=6063 RepID=UPI00312BC95A
MASKSLTALPSVVSIVAEKTVVALRCHTRGFEKVLWPILAIILTAGALICFAVAAGTPMWVQINLSEPTSTTDPDKGYIAFGIFSGSHVIELRADTFIDRDEESYLVFERYTNILISRLYATFAFSLIAMLFCLALIAVTFINSYQTVTTWWKGPSMMYILSVLTSLSAFTATALFADFYLWDMDTAIVFMDSFIIPGNEAATFYLMSYTRVPTLHYSSALQIGGIIMMDIMFYRTHV